VNTMAVSERTWTDQLRLFIDITRPKVIALVVFTGLPAIYMGKDIPLGWTRLFWILAGTAMAGAASSAFNAYIERESDAQMARTRNRPLPASSVLPEAVLVYGGFLTIASTAILHEIGGWVAAAVGLGTIVFYVFGYTVWLKPRTPQNIVIGGAAGSTAPLIASAAVDGQISAGAWILFAIIFLWTPPHFWGIALVRKNEYAAAGLPMMPLVVGDQPTRWRSLGYTLVLLPVTLLPVWLGYLHGLYFAVAAGLGLWFLWAVIRSLRTQQAADDWAVFKVSLVYLTCLFMAMLADLAIPWGST